MLFSEQVLLVQSYMCVFFFFFFFWVFWFHMLFTEQVLMVQGYNSKTSWGFPKGKMETHESEIECAIREVRPVHSCFLLGEKMGLIHESDMEYTVREVRPAHIYFLIGKKWDSFMSLRQNVLLLLEK